MCLRVLVNARPFLKLYVRNCPISRFLEGDGELGVRSRELLLSTFATFKVCAMWIRYQFEQINKLDLRIL